MDRKAAPKYFALAFFNAVFVATSYGMILRLSCKIFADFSVVKSNMSLEASYKTYPTDENSCKAYCIMDTQCKSINVNEYEGICQLNNKSDQDPTDSIQASVNHNWVYFSTKYNETSIGENCRTYGNCHSGEKCLDTCYCPGYECIDINECLLGTHICHNNATCINGNGSYTCACKPGYTGNETHCSDINECSPDTYKCHINATCSNSIGSYTCNCKPGYTGDGTHCSDINECSLGTHKCHNNATCINDNGSYTCACKPGYTGNGTHCRACSPGYSGNATHCRGTSTCLDWYSAGARANDTYTILDAEEKPLKVYCDMTSEGNSSWTLVASYSLANVEQFKRSPFYNNNPLDEENVQWDLYRLSKYKMERISSSSTHWRMTCSYPEYRFDFRDYIRGKISQINPFTFQGTKEWKTVEFINVRGKYANNLLIPFWQSSGTTFHTDSNEIDFFKNGSVKSEDNFGYYASINREFRCTERQNSTTQLWFGGLH